MFGVSSVISDVQKMTVCVVAVMCFATNVSSSSSKTKVIVRSLDILHDLIILFAFIVPIILKLPVYFYSLVPLHS